MQLAHDCLERVITLLLDKSTLCHPLLQVENRQKRCFCTVHVYKMNFKHFFSLACTCTPQTMAILSPLHEEFSLDAQPLLIVSKTHAKASSFKSEGGLFICLVTDMANVGHVFIISL